MKFIGATAGTFTAADSTKLSGIEANADVTDATNVTAAGALMDSELTDLSGVKGVTISTLQVKPTEGAFANGDKTKLDGIEASADVTDTANVTAAGALMDSEVTNLSQVKAFDSSDYATPSSVNTVHATAQTGKNYRIINTSFRDDIGTDKHYLPLKSQDEQTLLTREEGTELAVCDGRLVSATVRLENMAGSGDDFTLTIGVETNDVGGAYGTFDGTSETEVLTVSTTDDHHVFHFVFDTAKHWDSTDMFAISIQASEDHWGSNERFFVTLVIEDDWSTYLAGSSREIDTTP